MEVTCPPELESYWPFIRKGFVSMVGSDVRVPVTILRDMGALTLSFRLEFCSSIPVHGMDLNVCVGSTAQRHAPL